MTATPQGKMQRPAETDAAAILERAVLRARRVILWERVWPALVTCGVAVALFLIASWAGLWLVLPPVGRIIGVVAFAALLGVSLIPLLRLKRPTRAEALARLDHGSGLLHRPATAIGDTLATKPDDPIGAALWRAHVARTIAAARALRAGIPTPGLAARDPQALRALALVGLVAAFFLAPGSHWSRVRTAFDWRGAVTPQAYRLDAWIDPPAYTGRPPLVLPGLRSDDANTAQAAAVSVPVGSVLVVRAAGIDTDALKIDGLEEIKPAADAPAPPAEARAGAAERRFTVARAGSVQFTGPDQRTVSWRIAAIADTKPSIAFAKDPQTGPRNALVLSYRVEDDYGVKDAQAVFTPTPPERGLFPRPGSPAPVLATPLVAAPDFALTLPQAGAKGGAGQTSKDLVAHPWAGGRVQVTLKVHDEAGNEGVSETRTFRLPARAFSKPIARALIEERRQLAFDPSTRPRVESMLAALTLAPDQFSIPPAEYLGLRTAYYRLHNARSDDDLRGVVDYLWDVAVLIEDGTLSAAERELRAAQEALREALQRGASDEEIKRLAQDLRQAMEKMMRQLAEEARRDGGTDARPLDQNTRVIRPQDLQRMVDRIENLARSGSRDAAKQLLDELQAMMDGLKPGNRQAGRQQGQQQQSELGAMIQEQQRLRDRTYREGRPGQQGQQGQQGQRGQRGQQGQQGQPGQDGQEGEGAFGDLQQGQQELRRRLGQMLEQLKRQQQGQGRGQGQQGQGQQGQGEGEGGDPSGRAGEAFGRAEQAMRDAEGALGEGNGQGALDAQGRALQALRQGAQAMAEGQQGDQNGPGPGGTPGESAERTDPLGRPMRTQDYGDDFSVKVPDEVDAQRARQVLEELRRRLEQTERPQQELDYIERLLRNF